MRLAHEPHLQETEAYASKLLALDINIRQTSLVKQNHKRALELGDEAWYSVYKLASIHATLFNIRNSQCAANQMLNFRYLK